MVGVSIMMGGRVLLLTGVIVPSVSSISITPARAPLVSAVRARDDCAGVRFIVPMDGRTIETGCAESIVREEGWGPVDGGTGSDGRSVIVVPWTFCSRITGLVLRSRIAGLAFTEVFDSSRPIRFTLYEELLSEVDGVL